MNVYVIFDEFISITLLEVNRLEINCMLRVIDGMLKW